VQHLLNYQDWINESLTEWQLVTEDEGWGDWISTSLHLVGDLASAVADCIVLGSGSVIDAVNALSYFIEADFEEDENRKDMLMISGIIQIISIFIVGPLQWAATELKMFVTSWFIAIKNSRLLATMVSKLPTIIAALKAIQTGFMFIITKVISWIGPGSKFAQVAIWISEQLNIPNAIRWINDFLINKAQPILKNFLEKLVRLIPQEIKQVILAGGQHEAEELALKNLSKALIKGYTENQVSNVMTDVANDFVKYKLTVNKFELENQAWWASKLAAAPTSALTPVSVPTNQPPKINYDYDFLNNPQQPFNPPFGR
jgi:hypothetical protein